MLAPSTRDRLIGNCPACEVDVNTFHVGVAHANGSSLRETAREDSICGTGEPVPSTGRAMAKEVRA